MKSVAEWRHQERQTRLVFFWFFCNFMCCFHRVDSVRYIRHLEQMVVSLSLLNIEDDRSEAASADWSWNRKS